MQVDEYDDPQFWKSTYSHEVEKRIIETISQGHFSLAKKILLRSKRFMQIDLNFFHTRHSIFFAVVAFNALPFWELILDYPGLKIDSCDRRNCNAVYYAASLRDPTILIRLLKLNLTPLCYSALFNFVQTSSV